MLIQCGRRYSACARFWVTNRPVLDSRRSLWRKDLRQAAGRAAFTKAALRAGCLHLARRLGCLGLVSGLLCTVLGGRIEMLRQSCRIGP
jgi:hypothetical protein